MPAASTNTYVARALSGAAASGTAVGGSIAVNYVDTSARADVGDNAVVTGTTGDARVEATNLNEIQNISGRGRPVARQRQRRGPGRLGQRRRPPSRPRPPSATTPPSTRAGRPR